MRVFSEQEAVCSPHFAPENVPLSAERTHFWTVLRVIWMRGQTRSNQIQACDKSATYPQLLRLFSATCRGSDVGKYPQRIRNQADRNPQLRLRHN